MSGLIALLLAATTAIGATQALAVLRITVVVTGPDGKATPVGRHLLLVSDNPASAPPRRILTAVDGSVEVRLRPGNYTVESDHPVGFEGQAYQWMQTVDLVAGRDTVLTLTAANAEIGAITADTTSLNVPSPDAPVASPATAPNRATAVTIWTPLTRALGSVIGTNGLVVTRYHASFSGMPVEVQLPSTPAIKVAAIVLVSDAARNVAILWVDPATAALAEPAPPGCGEVCDLLAIAETKMKGATPPPGTRLPVEPATGYSAAALNNPRAGNQAPYQMAAADFDVSFITPPQLYTAQKRFANLDFKNWSDYVTELPPVLMVRVTPKMEEGFWTKVGRGAAQTQGIALPPMKRPKAGFARLRAYCGETEVTPIHPFKMEQRVSATEAIFEGLYVFDPAAFSPACGGVKFLLYSEKEPDKADTRVLDPNVIQQIWQDFAPLRPTP